MTPGTTVRVVIADDQALFREGLRTLLSTRPDIDVAGEAANGEEAVALVETLSPDLSRVRLFHTSVSRAIASWPTWPGEPGYTEFDEFLAAEFPTATAADFAILEAGVTSEDTYVEQGLYWSTGHWPMLEYVADTYDPDLLLVGMPTTDEFQHQFLGLVSKRLPNGARNPAYDDVDLDGVRDGRVKERAGYIREAYAESIRAAAASSAAPAAGWRSAKCWRRWPTAAAKPTARCCAP